jgi:transposase-like protein
LTTVPDNLVLLGDTWRGKYPVAVRSRENNWEDLATFFDYPVEIRRLIYTTNTVEGYNRQVRKVIKTKGIPFHEVPMKNTSSRKAIIRVLKAVAL